MNISSFIAARIAFNQQKSFSRFIIRLSITATTISVAVMIVTLSFVNGFQETVSNKVFSFWGHIRIGYRQPMKATFAEEEPIESNDTLKKNIQNIIGVKSIYPFATKYAILKTTNDMEGVLLKGLDVQYDFSHLNSFLKEGRWIHYNDSTYSREIVISTITAKALNLRVNDKVLIYFIGSSGSIRPDKLTVTGIYKTSIEEYDKTYAIGDIRLIRKLNRWDDKKIGGYEVFIKDYKEMKMISDSIYYLPRFPQIWEARTIKDIYPNIFDWLNIQNTNQNILITIMSLIAIINLITCLIILVLERLRMIGILKALGATNWTIQKIFLNHSLLITLSGVILGAVFAFLVLWLQQVTGFVTLPEDAYIIHKAVVIVIWWQVLLVCLGTIFISLLVLFIPSLIVRRIQPIKAIRFT